MSNSWHEIHKHLMRNSSTLGFQHGFNAIRSDHPVLSQFHDPAGLLDALHHSAATADEKNALLRALIEAAQDDGTAADCALTLMLLALWAGLDAIYRRSRWRGAGSVGEVSSEVLARATEAIRCLDLNLVNRIAATVLQNIERDLIRARQREVGIQGLMVDTPFDYVAAKAVTSAPDVALALIHHDMARLVGADAGLVILVAVGGASHAEVATAFGMSAAAARKRYQRTIIRLREAFSEAA